MRTLTIILIILSIVSFITYTIVGTSGNVDEIKRRAPLEMPYRNWQILRYEGYQYGSWGQHGGLVWYHVANIDNLNIQYRVAITLWNNELQYYYGKPEELNRIQLDIKNSH